MAVPDQNPFNVYTANGVTTVFPYEFYLINAGDLTVSLNGDAVSTGFTVTGIGNVNGGEVTFLTPPANDVTVMLERVVAPVRLTEYQDNGDLLADTVNLDFDRLWMAIKQSFVSLGVALLRPVFGGPFNAKGYRIANLSDPVNDQDAATKKWTQSQDYALRAKTLRVSDVDIPVLPDAAQRANKVPAFDSAGNPTVMVPVSGSATDVLIQLAQEDGAGLVNTPYGGSVLSVMSTSKYIRRGKFGLSGAVITSNSEAVLNQADGRYYAYRADISTPVAIPSLPNLDWICVGNGRMPNGTHTLFDFGCIDDNGITDNRANIQLAIDYMNYCGSVMYTDSTRDDKFFGVSSFHPSYPGVALASTSIRNTKIVGGRKRRTSIRWVGTDVGEALFSVEATAPDWGMTIDGLGLNAGNKLNHVFKASKVHAAICEFNGGCYEEGVLDGIHLSAYNATFNNVYVNSNGRDGFALGGPDSAGGWTSDVTTSVTFNACWSRANIRRGYFVANELWYSNFISTACDGISSRRTQLAYELANAKAVVMSGIGAEECQKVLKAYAFSLSVDGLQLSGVHADEAGGTIPVSDSFIELAGFNINLSGLATLTSLNSYFTNDVTVNATGETKVTVLDSSFRDKRFNIVKASGISFFRYPEVVYFASGCYSDSACDRTGNEIYAPSSYAIRPSITKVASSVVRRTQAFNRTTAGFNGLMTVIDGNDAFIVVDIVCHTANNAEAFEKRVIAYKNANGWQKVEKGDTQSVFSVSVASGFIQIQTLVAGSISYIVHTRYSSTDGAIQFSF